MKVTKLVFGPPSDTVRVIFHQDDLFSWKLTKDFAVTYLPTPKYQWASSSWIAWYALGSVSNRLDNDRMAHDPSNSGP